MVCTVRITSPELPPMAEQYTGHVKQTEPRDNDTALPFGGSFCQVIRTLRTISNHIINYSYEKCKCKMIKYNRSKSEFLRLLLDIDVFRLKGV